MVERYSKIVATGSYIPTTIVSNTDFCDKVGPFFREFFKGGVQIPTESAVREFEDVSGIKERRYVKQGQTMGDIAFLAAKDALESSQVDPNSLDGIIVAHNAIASREIFVQCAASTVRDMLGITKENLFAKDVTSGCPGWLDGVIEADEKIRIRPDINKVLIVGADVASRMFDPKDRNGMLFGDGAGAVVLQYSEEPGFLPKSIKQKSISTPGMFYTAASEDVSFTPGLLYPKLIGGDVLKSAIKYVPDVLMESLNEAEISLQDLRYVFSHQANPRINGGILKKLLKMNQMDLDQVPSNFMPMTVHYLGNTSVASIPTMLDLASKGKIEGKRLESGEHIGFIAFGAGMNLSSVIYRMHP